MSMRTMFFSGTTQPNQLKIIESEDNGITFESRLMTFNNNQISGLPENSQPVQMRCATWNVSTGTLMVGGNEPLASNEPFVAKSQNAVDGWLFDDGNNFGSAQNVNSLCHNGTYYFAINEVVNGTVYQRSTDGIDWTAFTNLPTPTAGYSWKSIASVGANLCVVDFAGKSAYSTNNGTSWSSGTYTLGSTLVTANFVQLQNINSRFEFHTQTKLFYSTNGTTWSSVTFPGSGFFQASHLAGHDTHRLITGTWNGQATDICYYSTDSGASWNPSSLAESCFSAGLSWNGTRYVNFQYTGAPVGGLSWVKMSSSTDAIDWTITEDQVQINPIGIAISYFTTQYKKYALMSSSRSISSRLIGKGLTVSSSRSLSIVKDLNLAQIVTSTAEMILNKAVYPAANLISSLSPAIRSKVGFFTSIFLGSGGIVSGLPTKFDWHLSNLIESTRLFSVGVSNREWHLSKTILSQPLIGSIRKIFWGKPWSMLYEFAKWVGVKADSSLAVSSTDGATWTERTLPSSRAWNTIATNGTVIIAMAIGSNKVSTSTNGTTWTERTLPTTKLWRAICSDGTSRFVAVSLQSNTCLTTEDGITWTERTLPKNSNWTSVCYGNGKFVATTDSDVVAYSSDGITWTESIMPDNIQYNCVTYHLSQFTAVASGPTDLAAVSTDGITWTRITMPAVANWTSIGPGIGNPNE